MPVVANARMLKKIIKDIEAKNILNFFRSKNKTRKNIVQNFRSTLKENKNALRISFSFIKKYNEEEKQAKTKRYACPKKKLFTKAYPDKKNKIAVRKKFSSDILEMK